MVMGPTPPGTGVMAFAFLLLPQVHVAAKAIVRAVDAHIDDDCPSFTISAVMNFWASMAAGQKSASRHTWARLAVLEWHTADSGVAEFSGTHERGEARAFPTMLDLPTTTARFLPSVGKS